MSDSANTAPLVKAEGAFSQTIIDDEIVVMSLESGDFFSLTGTARAIWERLDAKPTRAALLAGLAEEFDADEVTIASECDRFLDQLRAARLLA